MVIMTTEGEALSPSLGVSGSHWGAAGEGVVKMTIPLHCFGGKLYLPQPDKRRSDQRVHTLARIGSIKEIICEGARRLTG